MPDRTFEIFTENYSKILQADCMIGAIAKFQRLTPESVTIIAVIDSKLGESFIKDNEVNKKLLEALKELYEHSSFSVYESEQILRRKCVKAIDNATELC